MSDLNTLIQVHWNAKAALEAATFAEREARTALSEFLCKDEVGLKNKTMNLSGGYKLKHEVARTVNVKKSHADYSELPRILTPEQLNAFVRKKEVLEFSLSGYTRLPDEARAKMATFASIKESVTIKYETTTDDR